MQNIQSCPIIDRAKREVTNFCSMYKRLEQKVVLGGLSNSTLLNYGRCMAKISLHFLPNIFGTPKLPPYGIPKLPPLAVGLAKVVKKLFQS